MKTRYGLSQGISTASICVAASILGACTMMDTSRSGASVVFLHGAHLTAESWADVERIVGKDGTRTRSLTFPGRGDMVTARDVTLESSSSFLCEQIRNELAPVILVAHSQAGAIANHALSICPDADLRTIIYVAAVVPQDGETPFARLSPEDEANYMQAMTYDETRNMVKIVDQEVFWSIFGVAPEQLDMERLGHLSVDEPAEIANGVVRMDQEKFASVRKFYVLTNQDLIISMKSQQDIVDSLDLVSSAVINTGHVPMLTDPEILADTILHFIQDY